MAIFCGKCGSKVGVIGACKTCKKEQAAKDKAGAEAYRTNFRANASAGDKSLPVLAGNIERNSEKQ